MTVAAHLSRVRRKRAQERRDAHNAEALRQLRAAGGGREPDWAARKAIAEVRMAEHDACLEARLRRERAE